MSTGRVGIAWVINVLLHIQIKNNHLFQKSVTAKSPNQIRKSSFVTTSNTTVNNSTVKEIQSSAPNSIGHAIWPQGSHHDEFLQGAFSFPVLWKLLLLRTLRLYYLLPAFRRALNVAIKTTKLISKAHHLVKDKRQQVVICDVICFYELEKNNNISIIKEKHVCTCTLIALHVELDKKSRGLT